ncbi:MAG TPA: cytochrome c oxidase assembly factor 1 family protein [Thermoanaerobaculia bacterium]|jgi:ABC-type dipeptide/oligopeptide/nickel transport system permease subunit|nr:cytochrome c oxidase assembly factor 1 family protein [Thermoanaerobaculia bacterium]
MSDKKSSPLVWVAIGCGVLFAGMVAFFAFVFFVVFASMRSAAPYKDSVAYAKADPRVIQALGAPVEPGWFISGSINTSGRSGSADIDIPLKGSKQKGSLHVVGTKEGGRWTYSRMIMTPDKGEPIDLLAGGPGLSARLAGWKPAPP